MARVKVTATFNGSQDTVSVTWAGVGAQHSIRASVVPSDGYGAVRPWLTSHSSTGATVNVSGGSWKGTITLVVMDDPNGIVWPSIVYPYVADLTTSTLPNGVTATRSSGSMYAARGANAAAVVPAGQGVFEDYGLAEGGGWWTFASYSNRCAKPFNHADASWTATGSNTLTVAASAGPAPGGPAADRFIDTDAGFDSNVKFDLADSVNCVDSFWVKDAPAPNAPTAAGGLANGDRSVAYPAGSSSNWVRASAGHATSTPGTIHQHIVSGFTPPSTIDVAQTGGRDLWGDSQTLGYADRPLVDGTTSAATLQLSANARAALIAPNGDIDIRCRYLADYLDVFDVTAACTLEGGWIFSMMTPQGLFGVRYDVSPGLGNNVFVFVAKGVDFLTQALDAFPGGSQIDVRMTYKPSTGAAALAVGYNGGFQLITGSAAAGAIGTPTAAWIGSNLGSTTGIIPRRHAEVRAMTDDPYAYDYVVLGDSITANFDGLFLMGASTFMTATEAKTKRCLSFSLPFRTIDDEQGYWDASPVKGNANIKAVILQVGFNNNVIAGDNSTTILSKLSGLVADINASNPSAKILLGPLTPARSAMTAGQYTTWQAVNAGIAGGSVTGSNITILPAWSVLNDSSDNLKAIYDQLGDHTHPNNPGRLASFGVTWRATLQSLGLL